MNDKSTIAKLVIDLQKKQKAAFKSLYEMHVKQMLSVSYRILSDINYSEDAVQEAFITCYEQIDSLSDPRAFSSWLKRIVINKSLNKLRSKQLVFEEVVHEYVDEQEVENWYQGISLQTIKEKLLHLPDKSRVIFTLKAIEGLTHVEIANELEISTSTSKSQYRYGLQLLKKSLLKYRQYEI